MTRDITIRHPRFTYDNCDIAIDFSSGISIKMYPEGIPYTYRYFLFNYQNGNNCDILNYIYGCYYSERNLGKQSYIAISKLINSSEGKTSESARLIFKNSNEDESAKHPITNEERKMYIAAIIQYSRIKELIDFALNALDKTKPEAAELLKKTEDYKNMIALFSMEVSPEIKAFVDTIFTSNNDFHQKEHDLQTKPLTRERIPVLPKPQ